MGRRHGRARAGDRAAMRFAADCMLGTLAKWLRVLGHDVAYFRTIEDGDLADLAAREGRTILTADRRLARRRQARDHILIKGHDLRRQIEQVLRERRLTIASEPLLGRCLRCNAVTETVAPEAVRDQVPIYVYRTQERFTRCPGCARVYWRATHVTRMLTALGATGGESAKPPATPRRGTRRRARQAPGLEQALTRAQAALRTQSAPTVAAPAARPRPGARRPGVRGGKAASPDAGRHSGGRPGRRPGRRP